MKPTAWRVSLLSLCAIVALLYRRPIFADVPSRCDVHRSWSRSRSRGTSCRRPDRHSRKHFPGALLALRTTAHRATGNDSSPQGTAAATHDRSAPGHCSASYLRHADLVRIHRDRALCSDYRVATLRQSADANVRHSSHYVRALGNHEPALYNIAVALDTHLCRHDKRLWNHSSCVFGGVRRQLRIAAFVITARRTVDLLRLNRRIDRSRLDQDRRRMDRQ